MGHGFKVNGEWICIVNFLTRIPLVYAYAWKYIQGHMLIHLHVYMWCRCAWTSLFEKSSLLKILELIMAYGIRIQQYEMYHISIIRYIGNVDSISANIIRSISYWCIIIWYNIHDTNQYWLIFLTLIYRWPYLHIHVCGCMYTCLCLFMSAATTSRYMWTSIVLVRL